MGHKPLPPDSPPDSARIHHAARILAQGGVIAYPTEGVYGLGCDPWNRAAVNRLLRLKGRPRAKGLILIAADWETLDPLMAPLSDAEHRRLHQVRNQPVTWVVSAAPEAPSWVRGSHQTIALRVTDHPVAAELCRAFRRPLVSTSANPAGEPTARRSVEVRQYFGDRLDMLLSGPLGDAPGPSEIRDLRTNEVLRPGSGTSGSG